MTAMFGVLDVLDETMFLQTEIIFFFIKTEIKQNKIENDCCVWCLHKKY